MYAYLSFNIKVPLLLYYGFRYITPVFIINSILPGRFPDLNGDKKWGKAPSAVISIFSLLPLLMLCICLKNSGSEYCQAAVFLLFYSLNFLNTKALLCPPKPKELEIA